MGELADKFPSQSVDRILGSEGTEMIITKELSLPAGDELVFKTIKKLRILLEEVFFKEVKYKNANYSPTLEHSLRTTIHIPDLAKRIGEDVHTAVLVALLHDIGKKETPNRVIFNSHKRKGQEKGAITRLKNPWLCDDRVGHLQRGQEILEKLGLTKIAKNVGHSHEKLDGTGYKRLKGNEILKIALMIKVVDTIDSFSMNPEFVTDRGAGIEELKSLLSDANKYDQEIVEIVMQDLDRYFFKN